MCFVSVSQQIKGNRLNWGWEIVSTIHSHRVSHESSTTTSIVTSTGFFVALLLVESCPQATMVRTRSSKRPLQEKSEVSRTKRPGTLKKILVPEKSTSDTAFGLDGLVDGLFHKAGIQSTVTRGGWCLKQALNHVLEIDNGGRLSNVIKEKGLPAVYEIVEDAPCRHETSTETDKGSTAPQNTAVTKKPKNCFQSLCRIITGQQLAGAAARAVWHRLLDVCEDDLTPCRILRLAKEDAETNLRKPAGLSRAKCNSIVALANSFDRGDLTEAFLSDTESSEAAIREALLPVKGIGPWTCDMFLMFYLEKGNILPLGDLGVRKGIAKYFGLVGKGKGYKGSLCQVKDKELIDGLAAPHSPFRSVFTYYMWIVADTKDFYGGKGS